MPKFAASFKLKQHEEISIIIVSGLVISPIRDECREV